MKIGIISDTHDHHTNVLIAIELFREQAVDAILHAGDIVSPFTAKALLEADVAPITAVFGNNEGEKVYLQQMFDDYGSQIHQGCFKGDLGGRDVLMMHEPYILDEAIHSQDHDLIIYGHTHKHDIRQIDRTLVINPGEASDWITGQGSIVILNLETMKYKTLTL